MDVDSAQATATSNVDDWLACFSPVSGSKPGAFPFTSHKILTIESRRAHMSDLLILDILLIRGGIRSPDVLFPPADWASLGKLLHAIDESVYDILKKDCLVYILLKWAWDMDPKEANPGWDARYVQDRCIAPQFAALANAYWLLDTGTHLAKAVSILADARLNRDYVSKILQALALSSPSGLFTSGPSSAAAALIVKYVRTAKPLLVEPDDIDLYALSLAQLSFMDAWAYQKSFPEASDTRERLLGKIIAWCLMPTPKQEPLAQLLAFPLSSYEQSTLHTLALPSQFQTSLSLSSVNTVTTSGPVLSSHAIAILQDLLCVRAIQSGDYVHAIKLDRQFSSVSPSLAIGTSSSSIASQSTSSGRDAIDRRSIIQDLFATLPSAERTLLEDEIGKVATGVRANAPSPMAPRQGPFAGKRPLTAELSLSASWEDVGADRRSPAPSTSARLPSPAVSAVFAGKTTPVPVSTVNKVNQSSMSPFTPRISRPQMASTHPAPPTPKFTAFGSPIPPTTSVNMGRGVITERGKTLFSTSAAGGPSTAVKPVAHVSLFNTAGSAKTAPNAFYKPPSAPAISSSLGMGSVLAGSGVAKSTGQGMNTAEGNGKAQGGQGDDEDVSMDSGSDVEIIEEDHRHESGREEQDEEVATDADEDDAENFVTSEKSGAADLTLHTYHDDDMMDEDHGTGPELGFSVFSGIRSAVQNGSTSGHGKKGTNGNGHSQYASSPPRACASPSRDGDKSLSISVHSTTTSRQRVPPGAFHHEEEDDEEDDDEHENASDNEEEEEDGRVSLTTPIRTPRRSTRTRTQPETPSRPPQRQRSSKNITATSTVSGAKEPSRGTSRASSNRPSVNQTIPGSLMDEENDEHEQDDGEHTDVHRDEDTEIDEQEEDDDEIAPLPSRSSRRTRSSGHVGTSTTTTSTKPKASAKPTSATVTAAKGKVKARSSEVKTPARRSSRLSTASSVSPDYHEAMSPTKKGRKSTGARASVAGSGSGTVATRSSTRRKR